MEYEDTPVPTPYIDPSIVSESPDNPRMVNPATPPSVEEVIQALHAIKAYAECLVVESGAPGAAPDGFTVLACLQLIQAIRVELTHLV